MKCATDIGKHFTVFAYSVLLLPLAFCYSPDSNLATTNGIVQPSESRVDTNNSIPVAVAALYHHYRDDSGQIGAGAWDDGEVVLVDFGPGEGEVTVKCFRISDQQIAELKRRLKFTKLRSMLHDGDPFDPRAGNWVMLNRSGTREYWKWDEVFTTWPVNEGLSYRFEIYEDAWFETEAAIKESIRGQQPTRVINASNEEWKRGFDPIRLTKPELIRGVRPVVAGAVD